MMQRGVFGVAAWLACAGMALANPQIPGAPQKAPVAITGATIHPASGPVIENGTLVFAGGKITALGAEVTPPADAEVIDGSGKHVYPSLIDALTDLGLVEINSIRATVDARETGDLNPNVRALVAVNPDSELIPVTRSNGVLVALTAPHGSLVPGKSAVIQLDGWTWEEMALKAEAALHIEWPRPGEAEQGIERLRQALEDARAYAAARKADTAFPHDARWEALQDVLSQNLPVVVHADDVRQITAAVSFAEREKLKLIIAGGYDALRCADLLKKHDVPVIVGGTYRLPKRRAEAYDAAYALPAELHKAGIKFCIASQGRFGASNVRNLPYHATSAVAFGLTEDQALQSITLWPAQILGVAERVGSLEVGKHATLFIADGPILDTPTHVEAAWVQGRKVDLNDRHKTLYRKYEEKYKQAAP